MTQNFLLKELLVARICKEKLFGGDEGEKGIRWGKDEKFN